MGKLGVFGKAEESSESTGLQRMVPGSYRGGIKPKAQLASYKLAWLPYSMARAILLALRIQLR